MIYYLGILLSTFFSQFFSNSLPIAGKVIYRRIYFLLLTLFMCFGYMCGTDWRNYEKLYSWLYEDGALARLTFVEPGYLVYMLLFQSIGISFWPFFIMTKILTLLIFVISIKRLCPEEKIYLALTFFIAIFGFFLWIDNPMRNLIAVSIFLLGVPALINRERLKYTLITVVAMSLHFSAVIMIFIYWVANKNFSTRKVIIYYIIANIVFINTGVIHFIINSMFSWVPFISGKITAYLVDKAVDGDGKLFSIGFIVHNIFFVLIIVGRKQLDKLKYGNMLFNLSILCLIFYRIGLSITVIGRLQLYVSIFYAISVVSIISGLKREIKITYALYVLVVSIGMSVSYLVKDERYIPYSNYLYYAFREKPSFEERDNYNLKNRNN